MTLNLEPTSRLWCWPCLDSSLWPAWWGWEVVTDVHVDSRGLSPVSLWLWDEHLQHRSLPAAQTPVTGKVETFCGQSPTKQTIRGMSGMQGMWCGVVWVCFFCSSFVKEILNYFVWRHNVELRTPGEWKSAGGSRPALPLFLHLGLHGTILYLVYFAQALAFSSGPQWKSGWNIEAGVAAGGRHFLGEENHSKLQGE